MRQTGESVNKDMLEGNVLSGMRGAISDEQMCYLMGALLSKRKELLGAEVALPASGSRHGDMADQSSGSIEVAIQQRTREINARVLQAVENALARVKSGSYGICPSCNEQIPFPRLEAIPWARTCVPCKERRG